MSNRQRIFLFTSLLCLHGGLAAPSACGNWQDAYTKLHHDVLAGKRPPRYAVAVAVEAGLTDNIVGIVTAFFYAVLSDRAFQMLTHSDLPDFSDAYDYPHINLTRQPGQDAQHLTQPLHYKHVGSREYGPDVDAGLYAPAYLVNADGDNDRIFSSEDLKHWPSGGKAETVFLGTNRGRVVKLFANAHHSKHLYDMGLRPDTIFACGYRYLFEPNKAVKSLFQQYMDNLQASPAALRIGINIRAGDAVFSGHKVGPDVAKNYISCALEVEDTRKGANQSVVWYVISESLELRRAIKDSHESGRTVITDTTTVIQHTNCHQFGSTHCAGSAAHNLRMAVGQLWVFSATDVQIVTIDSGFGRVGAFLSPKFHQIYGIGNEPRSCGAWDYDRVEQSASQWAGIRGVQMHEVGEREFDLELPKPCYRLRCGQRISKAKS